MLFSFFHCDCFGVAASLLLGMTFAGCSTDKGSDDPAAAEPEQVTFAAPFLWGSASAGFQYRPWLNDNVVFTAGASVFAPAAGFRNLLTSQTLVAPFAVLTLRY